MAFLSTWPLPGLEKVLVTGLWQLPLEQVTREGQCWGNCPF